MKSIKRMWDDIRKGENIDLYIAVPLAVTLAILSTLGITSNNLIAPITLIILSLLATSLLRTIHAVNEIPQIINQSTKTVFLNGLPADFRNDFERSNDIWLVGVSRTTIIRTYYTEMEKKLKNGHNIKIILVNPDGVALEMAEMRSYSTPNLQRSKAEIYSSLEYLCDLRAKTNGKLEIRVIDHPLSHGLIAMNPETTDGKLFIQYYSFKTAGGSRPDFILQPSDGEWYEFYKKEFNNLWDASKDWTCTS